MRRKNIITGLVAGGLLVGGAGAAFTATGLHDSTGGSQFIGGTVTQTVSGATLSSVAYGFTDGTNTEINAVTLKFAAGADGKDVAIDFGVGHTAFTCTSIAVSGSDHVSACAPAVDGEHEDNASSMTVTVSNPA